MAISSLSILPTGMPVQPEITSPTICASTQTRISGRFALHVVELGVRARRVRRAVRSGSAGGLARLRLRLAVGARGGGAPGAFGRAAVGRSDAFELAAHLADAVDEVALLFPAVLQLGEAGFGLRPCARRCCRGARCDRRRRRLRARERASARRDRRSRGGIFDGRRDGVLAQREARAGGIEHADRLVGKLAVGQIAVREA